MSSMWWVRHGITLKLHMWRSGEGCMLERASCHKWDYIRISSLVQTTWDAPHQEYDMGRTMLPTRWSGSSRRPRLEEPTMANTWPPVPSLAPSTCHGSKSTCHAIYATPHGVMSLSNSPPGKTRSLCRCWTGHLGRKFRSGIVWWECRRGAMLGAHAASEPGKRKYGCMADDRVMECDCGRKVRGN